MISCLLVAVAFWMGRDARQLLIGSAALPEEREALERAIEEFDEVDAVKELLTMVLGPNALLVAARIDLRDDLDGDRVERASTEIDHRLREVVPDVTEVFLDATPAREFAQVVRSREEVALGGSGANDSDPQGGSCCGPNARKPESGGRHDQAEVSSRPGGTPQGKMSQSSCLANEVGEQSVHPLGPMDASL